MTGEKFTLMQYSISAILGLIEAEDFVIPEIQRPFVWKRSQVRDLIDSLYSGYPTGYIITWKNPDVQTKDGGKANGKKILIDGQQRITSLMAAISGKEVLDEDFNKDRIKIAFNPLAEDETKRFAVQDASHLKDKKWIPDISVVFDSNFDPFDFALKYCSVNEGIKPYDVRFQTTQAIPVFINEMVVRLLYSIRRLIKYFITIPKEDKSLSLLWKTCEPFSNATVKRMLTVSHGTFCLIDIGDASIRAITAGEGTFNIAGFFLRFNIVGVGRFTISLYGEIKRGMQSKKSNADVIFIKRETIIVDDYIEGLKVLSEAYNDKQLLTFVNDFQTSELYEDAFIKSVRLAELRNVPNEKSVKSKAEIDQYFRGGSLCAIRKNQN